MLKKLMFVIIASSIVIACDSDAPEPVVVQEQEPSMFDKASGMVKDTAKSASDVVGEIAVDAKDAISDKASELVDSVKADDSDKISE